MLVKRLLKIRDNISAAEQIANRPPGSVRLLAVSKTKPVEDIICAYRKGQRDFGESYLQEALAKQMKLANYSITWHFIGPIQSNKTRAIANHFHWVHSIDRFKIAKRLSEQRATDIQPLNVCLQVNISGESSKSGIDLAELPELTAAVMDLPQIRLRGLMAIPKPSKGITEQRAPYRTLREALLNLNDPRMDTLSIGMSNDLEAAILEGSTIVRVGTAIFGRRD